MRTGEIRLESQQKTESPQLKQEEVETMHEVEQNKEFFKRESKECAMNKGCLKKKLSAKTNKKTHDILLPVKRVSNRLCILEKEVVIRYVDTYSG